MEVNIINTNRDPWQTTGQIGQTLHPWLQLVRHIPPLSPTSGLAYFGKLCRDARIASILEVQKGYKR